MPAKIDATERLLNLVIALLGTRLGHSKSYLRHNINGYPVVAGTEAEDARVQAAFERMFERDKKTLLELGIPVRHSDVQGDDAQEQVPYRIHPDDYRIPEIRLDESALTLVSIAAHLWAEATLGAAAQSALRKIALRAGSGWYEDDTTAQSRIRTAEPSFDALWTALRNHHPVTFSYRSSNSTESTTRTVEPWGLGNKYGQWYLAAFDRDRSAERHFRLSRITSDVHVHGETTFARPADFTIAPVLDRLGSGPVQTAHVALREHSGHALRGRAGTEAARYTDPATGISWQRPGWDVVQLSFREPELMADDIAALGDLALVLSPGDLREAVAGRLHRATAAALAPATDLDWTTPLAPRIRKKKDSRDRLVRLLSMVPYLVANPGVEEAEIMAEFGISAAQWEKDMDTLNVTGLPGYYHGDLMDVTNEAGQVFIRDAETLASPLRLTQEEACSVLIGLEALTTLPGNRQALDDALESLTAVAGDDAWLASAVGLQLISGQEMETITALQEAIEHHRACHMTYLVRSRDQLSERTIEPRRLFSVDSLWYVRAWCRRAGDLRSFRVDHIKNLTDAGVQEHGPSGSSSVQPHSIYDPSSGDVEVQIVADATTARRLGPAYNARLFDLGLGLAGLKVLVGDTATVGPLMARLGGHARVTGPEPVRAETTAWLIRAADSCDAVGVNMPAVPGAGG